MNNNVVYDDIFAKAWDMAINKAMTTPEAARRQAGTNRFGRKGLDLDRKKGVDSVGEAAKFADRLPDPSASASADPPVDPNTNAQTGPYNDGSASSRLKNLKTTGGETDADPRLGARVSAGMQNAAGKITDVVNNVSAKGQQYVQGAKDMATDAWKGNQLDSSGEVRGPGLRDAKDAGIDYAASKLPGMKEAAKTGLQGAGNLASAGVKGGAQLGMAGVKGGAQLGFAGVKGGINAAKGLANMTSNTIGSSQGGSHVSGQGMMNNVKNLATGLMETKGRGGIVNSAIRGQNKRGAITDKVSDEMALTQRDNKQARRTANMFKNPGNQSVSLENNRGDANNPVDSPENAVPAPVDPNAIAVPANAPPANAPPTNATTNAPANSTATGGAGFGGGGAGFGNSATTLQAGNAPANANAPPANAPPADPNAARDPARDKARMLQVDNANAKANTKGGIGTGLLSNVATMGMSGMARGAYNASQRSKGRDELSTLAKHAEFVSIRSSLLKNQYARQVTPGDRDGNGILDSEEEKTTVKLNPDGTVASKETKITQKTPSKEEPKKPQGDPTDMRMDADLNKGFKDVLGKYRQKRAEKELGRLQDRRNQTQRGLDFLSPNRIQLTPKAKESNDLDFMDKNRKTFGRMAPGFIEGEEADRGMSLIDSLKLNPPKMHPRPSPDSTPYSADHRINAQRNVGRRGVDGFNPDDAIQNSEPWNVVENPFANPFYNTNAFSLTKEPNHGINESHTLVDEFLKADISEPEVKLSGFDTNKGDDLSLLPASVFANNDAPVADNMSLLPTGWKQ
tara:strand:- start:18779 stop:21172 length:2394 start_codon:yes stop_codon:yes gene_type:complete